MDLDADIQITSINLNLMKKSESPMKNKDYLDQFSRSETIQVQQPSQQKREKEE